MTAVEEKAGQVVGVDVGGTKIAAGLVDSAGKVYGQVKLPTALNNTTATLDSITQAIQAAISAGGVDPSQIKGIGVGVPGKVDHRQGTGVYAANLGWQDAPVKGWLEDKLGIPCAVDNDVIAGTLGESLYGSGQGLANMVYLSLGTGIAARVIIEGRVYRGATGLAGEIGHTIFVPDGLPCLCGGRGCLETVASGQAIQRRAQAAIEAGRYSLVKDYLANTGVSAGKVTAEMVFEAGLQGDGLAVEILTGAGSLLAYAVHVLALTYDPQAIVLGGGLAHTTGPYHDSFRQGLEHWMEHAPLFRDINKPDFIRLSSLKRDAGIMGAAAIFNLAQVN